MDRLKAFHAFVRFGSMAAAAKELGLTQPGISLQLKALEESCPEKLFYFGGKKKELTPFGQKLFDSTSETLSLLDEKIRFAFESDDLKLKPIRIAGRSEILEKCLLSRGSHGPLEMIPCESTVAAAMVADRKVDLAITYHVPQSISLIAKPLFKSSPVLAYLKGKRATGPISAEFLRTQNWLVYKKDDPILKKLCSAYGVAISSLHFQFVAPSWKLLLSAALKGEGVVLLPFEYLTEEADLHVIRDLGLKNEESLTYQMIYPKEISKRAELQKLITQLKSHF